MHALLKTSANGDFVHIMQYVDFAVPGSAGNTVTYRLNITSGSFNMLMKPTNVQKCLRVSYIILYYIHSMVA